MKIIKRLLLVLLTILVLLIGAAFAIPFFFKDDLVALLKEEINKNVLAEVDFSDVNLSFFRSFPDLSLQVDDFSVTGIDNFAGTTLARGESLDFTLDLMSVFRSSEPVRIQAVNLRRPEINIYITKDGQANYDIAVPTDDRIESSADQGDFSKFRVELESYEITDGAFLYDDRSSDTYLQIQDLNHRGSGDFTLDIYDLDTETEVGSISVRQGGIGYLAKASASLDAVFTIDQTQSKYTLKDNELRVNALLLNADGYIQMAGEEDINLDLTFNTPQNEFKNLLSMIPNAYIEGYENVQADGRFALRGTVKGTYNGEREVYPAFQFDLNVDNARVKYPDLPLGISNIYAQASINSPGSDFDQLTIDVPAFSMKVADNPFKARFNLRTPISDPDLDADLEGVIDLAELAQAFPMEGIQELSGIIEADVTAKTRMSYIEREQYDRVDMDGQLKVQDITYQSEDLPPVNIREASLTFTPRNVLLQSFDAQLGRSDIQASGAIDNILAYFSPEQTMRGNLKVTSGLFDANEWVPAEEEPASPAVQAAGGGAVTENTEIFDRFDFDLDARVDEIRYDVYQLKNTTATGRITPNRLIIRDGATLIGDSDFAAAGVITNMFDYVFENGVLGGDLNIQSRRLDLNQFMTAEEGETVTAPSGETETLEPYLVPDNIAMQINAEVGELTYTNLLLKNLQGRVVIEDEAVVIEEATTETLGGRMAISGGYDTKDHESPAFELKYDLQSLNFQESFQAFNTFQQLAPIGKFIRGEFNSSLIMSGQLGKDLMPQLSSLNAQGFLETIDGVIQNFKPLQTIANTLNVNELKGAIPIQNTRNWFEISNGVVEVKPFDFNVKEIAMTIAGRHGLNQAMDYNIEAQIPRELLEKNALGGAASQGFDLLQSQASKLGIQLAKGEFVNVRINLTGSLQDPKVKLQLLGMDGETSVAEAAEQRLQDEIQQQKEKLQAEAEEKITEQKEALQQKAETLVDSARTVVEEEVGKAKEDLTRQAKEAVKEKVGEQLGSAVDTLLKEQGKEEIDKIQDELKKFNPFKKKKKEGGG